MTTCIYGKITFLVSTGFILELVGIKHGRLHSEFSKVLHQITINQDFEEKISRRTLLLIPLSEEIFRKENSPNGFPKFYKYLFY